MEALKIIGTSILLAILYGICHDLITANISVEYFTIGHPKVIESESPFHLALVWGVIATWWVGLILGISIAITSRIGKKPKLNLSDIIKPMLTLMMVMFSIAILAGSIGYVLAKIDVFYLVDRLARHIDPSRHHLFLTAGWAHGASYIVGFLGGIVLCFHLWRKRKLATTTNHKADITP